MKNCYKIYEVISGSRMYGTHTSDSDYDYRSIAFPHPLEFFGLEDSKEINVTNHETEDSTIYSVKRFVRLALAANPNILELLFAPIENITICTDFSETLRDLRKDFISQRIFKTYLGYVESQIKRMKKVEIGFPESAITYDPKPAMHVVRLLIQCEDLVFHRHINLPLEGQDLDFCLKVKAGEVKYSSLLGFIDMMVENLRNIESQFLLPEVPDFNKINKAVYKMHTRFYDRVCRLPREERRKGNG